MTKNNLSNLLCLLWIIQLSIVLLLDSFNIIIVLTDRNCAEILYMCLFNLLFIRPNGLRVSFSLFLINEAKFEEIKSVAKWKNQNRMT